MDHTRDKIRVNAFAGRHRHGPVTQAETAMRANSQHLRGPQYLMGRIGTVNEIANGALFLASDDCRFMNAADLLIDGGYIAFKGNKGNARLPN